MKVRMKEDKKAYPDGINEVDLKKGKTYELPADLAQAFVDQKLAYAVKPKKPQETKVEKPKETKVIEPPETK